MRAAQRFSRVIEQGVERRVSLRTQTSVGVLVRQGRRAFKGRAIDVSQGGILVTHRAKSAPTYGTPTELFLDLPGGRAKISAFPVRQSGRQYAYEFVNLSDADQQLLTDFMFCLLAEKAA